jgi:MOSC domain-containing protein YiiM
VTTYEVVSVNVAMPKVLLEHSSGTVESAIEKRPVSGAIVWLSELNLDGDRQADTRPTRAGGQVHGGADQAVYAFPSEHFPRLAEIVGAPVGPGLMGENVTLWGAVEDDVRIGDTWQWGDAVLQITAPRGPCYKLGIQLGRQALRATIRAEGLVGWYLRVLHPGAVPVCGPITRSEQHSAGVTVAAAHRALQDHRGVYPELAALDVMSANLRAQLRHRGRDLTGGVPEED